METPFQNNSIFFVDVHKIKPNPFQPRIEFDDEQLESLSESIRMYGVLQPLVVTRKEVFTEEGGMAVEYELIAGERRLRASKLAGMKEVPVVIRSQEQTDQEKLELAIIENLQREDLNPVDRAKAFRLLADKFNLKHAEIGKRVGKSREYVSNSLRLLALPEDMLAALTVRKISEGHARSLLTLGDRPEEQQTLFKEIMLKGLTVRQAEKIARRVAYDKVRKKGRVIDPHTVEVEEEISEVLGTRVHIERKAVGGKIEIDFFSEDDLSKILEVLKHHESELGGDTKDPQAKMNAFIEQSGGLSAATGMVFEKKKEIADAQETSVKEELPLVDVPVEKETSEDQEEHFSYADVLARPDAEIEESVEIPKEPEPADSKLQEVLDVPMVDTTESLQTQIQGLSDQTTEEIPQTHHDTPVFKSTEQPTEKVEEESITLDQDLQTPEMPVFAPVEQVETAEAVKEEPPKYSQDPYRQEVSSDDLIGTGIETEPSQGVVPQQVKDPHVQAVLESVQNPLPEGESVNILAETHAETHADELYYNLSQDAAKTDLGAPTEVATPHYGDAEGEDEDHLYRI